MSLIKKYSLNDFFNSTFKQIGPVTVKTFIPLIIILAPVSLLYGFGMVQFFKDFFILLPGLETAEMSVISDLLISYTKLLGMILIAGLGTTATMVIVISATGDQIFPGRESKEIKTLLTTAFPKIILSGLLQAVIILGIAIVFALFLGLLIFLSTLFLKGLMIFLVVILYIALYAALIWLIMSFSFSPFYIVLDEESVWPSLKRSVALVRHQWWRYFGMTILFSLCLSFAMSLITSPLVIFGMLPSFSQMFSSLGSGSMDEYEMMMDMFEFFQKDSFAVIMGVVMFIQSFASVIFMSLFKTLFFVDLKVRKGELTSEEETGDLPQ